MADRHEAARRADGSARRAGRDDTPWGDGAADLPTAATLLDTFANQVTGGDDDDGRYERTANRRADGVDRFEREVVVVGRVHRSVAEARVSDAGRVIVTHRLVRASRGLLDRIRRGGPDARRGIDAETRRLLRSEQRSTLKEGVSDRLVRVKTSDRIAGFTLGFETAASAPPRTAGAQRLSAYLSVPFPELVSEVVAAERRAMA